MFNNSFKRHRTTTLQKPIRNIRNNNVASTPFSRQLKTPPPIRFHSVRMENINDIIYSYFNLLFEFGPSSGPMSGAAPIGGGYPIQQDHKTSQHRVIGNNSLVGINKNKPIGTWNKGSNKPLLKPVYFPKK